MSRAAGRQSPMASSAASTSISPRASASSVSRRPALGGAQPEPVDHRVHPCSCRGIADAEPALDLLHVAAREQEELEQRAIAGVQRAERARAERSRELGSAGGAREPGDQELGAADRAVGGRVAIVFVAHDVLTTTSENAASMSIAWAPEPRTACRPPSRMRRRVSDGDATATVASASSSRTTSSDALSLRRRQSPSRGDPATTADPDVTRRSRGPVTRARCRRCRPARPPHRAVHPPDGEHGPDHLDVEVELRIHAHREPTAALPAAEPEALRRGVADDEHVALALDAVAAAHHEQLGDPRVGHDVDGLVGGPQAHGPRARRPARRAGGRPRPAPAGRPRPPRGPRGGSCRRGHRHGVADVDDARLLAERRRTSGATSRPASGTPPSRRRAGRRRCTASRIRRRSWCCASVGGACRRSPRPVLVLQQSVEMVESLDRARPARILGPVDDALVVGGRPVGGHPRSARREPARPSRARRTGRRRSRCRRPARGCVQRCDRLCDARARLEEVPDDDRDAEAAGAA